MTIATLLAAVGAMVLSTSVAGAQDARTMASGIELITVSGSVQAVDRDDSTVTLVGTEGGMLILAVPDRRKLDAIKVGDPVVAHYYEAVVLKVLPAITASPGVSALEVLITSTPAEIPAGALGSQVTLTTTVASVDKQARTVTIRGPLGGTEKIKTQDTRGLESLKVGDLVQITYTRALATVLDKRD